MPTRTSSSSSTFKDKSSFFKNILRNTKLNQNQPSSPPDTSNPPPTSNIDTKVPAKSTKRARTSKELKIRKHYHTRYYCPRHKRFHHDLTARSNKKPTSPLSSLTRSSKNPRIKSKRKSVRKVFDILSKSSDSYYELKLNDTNKSCQTPDSALNQPQRWVISLNLIYFDQLTYLINLIDQLIN